VPASAPALEPDGAPPTGERRPPPPPRSTSKRKRGARDDASIGAEPAWDTGRSRSGSRTRDGFAPEPGRPGRGRDNRARKEERGRDGRASRDGDRVREAQRSREPERSRQGAHQPEDRGRLQPTPMEPRSGDRVQPAAPPRASPPPPRGGMSIAGAAARAAGGLAPDADRHGPRAPKRPRLGDERGSESRAQGTPASALSSSGSLLARLDGGPGAPPQGGGQDVGRPAGARSLSGFSIKGAAAAHHPDQRSRAPASGSGASLLARLGAPDARWR
jgi:23S rRNA pseudouridine2605 synthase